MDDRAVKVLEDTRAPMANSIEVDVRSPAIMRLIEEVRLEEIGVPRSYNRTFNRHNR
jgi:hypothetical protein